MRYEEPMQYDQYQRGPGGPAARSGQYSRPDRDPQEAGRALRYVRSSRMPPTPGRGRLAPAISSARKTRLTR